MKNTALTVMLNKLVKDFNSRSELVALNYEQIKGGKIDDGVLQFNRGCLYNIKEMLEELAKQMGVELKFENDEHTFGYDDWKRQLTYTTVEAIWND